MLVDRSELGRWQWDSEYRIKKFPGWNLTNFCRVRKRTRALDMKSKISSLNESEDDSAISKVQ